MRSVYQRRAAALQQVLTVLSMVIVIGNSASAFAQSRPPFGVAGGDSESSELPSSMSRAHLLEKRFFETDHWTFYHSIDLLPSDVRQVLTRAAGTDVVGPGEPFDLTGVVAFPGRAQHLYTAVTDELGVTVWYSGGAVVLTHAVIFNRTVGEGCSYVLGSARSPVLPIRPVLRMLIQTRGASAGGCTFFSLN